MGEKMLYLIYAVYIIFYTYLNHILIDNCNPEIISKYYI